MRRAVALPLAWSETSAFAWAAIMKDGVTPQAAADKAFKRVEEIFANYPIG